MLDTSLARPRWLLHYFRQRKYYMMKLKSFTFGRLTDIKTLEASLSKDNVLTHFGSMPEDKWKIKVLNFVLIRNILKLQFFFRSLIQMRTDAAF